MSPRAANIRALGTAFNDADLNTDQDEVTGALEEVDPEGDVDNDGYDFTFQMRNGLQYNYGHGRNRCSYVRCHDRSTRPGGSPTSSSRAETSARGHFVSASDGTSQAALHINLFTDEQGREGREREEGLR